MIYRTIYYEDSISIKELNDQAEAEYEKIGGQKMMLLQIPESMRRRNERVMRKGAVGKPVNLENQDLFAMHVPKSKI